MVEKVVSNHFDNPIVRSRFEHAEMTREEMIDSAVEFFCTGLSGVETYTGRPLTEAHAGMNISEEEFVQVLDDMIAAMESLGIGELEQAEALKLLYGMKADVVRL